MEQTVDLSKAVVVQLDGTIWSGEAQLQPGDIKDLEVPESLVRLGSKRLFPRERLAPFEKLRRRAQRACKDCGPHWLAGYLVPTARLKGLLETLELIQQEFQAEKQAFLDAYEEGLSELEDSAGDWWPMIEPSILGRADVASRLSLQPVVFRPALGKDEGIDKDVYLGSAISLIPKRIMDDIAGDALDFWTKSIAGREKVNRRSLARLEKLREKIEGLAGLDRRLTKLATRVGEIQKQLPATGDIDDPVLVEKLNSILLLMTDKDKVDVYLSATSAQGETSEEALATADEGAGNTTEKEGASKSAKRQQGLPLTPARDSEQGRAHGLFA